MRAARADLRVKKALHNMRSNQRAVLPKFAILDIPKQSWNRSILIIRFQNLQILTPQRCQVMHVLDSSRSRIIFVKLYVYVLYVRIICTLYEHVECSVCWCFELRWVVLPPAPWAFDATDRPRESACCATWAVDLSNQGLHHTSAARQQIHQSLKCHWHWRYKSL